MNLFVCERVFLFIRIFVHSPGAFFNRCSLPANIQYGKSFHNSKEALVSDSADSYKQKYCQIEFLHVTLTPNRTGP